MTWQTCWPQRASKSASGRHKLRSGETRRRRLVGGAHRTHRPSAFAEANRGRNRTAELRNREPRGPQGLTGRESAVSGAEAEGAPCQNPRESARISLLTPRPGEGNPGDADWLAERVGFEPTVPFRVHALSRRVPSAARPSLREGGRIAAPRDPGPITPQSRGGRQGRAGVGWARDGNAPGLRILHHVPSKPRARPRSEPQASGVEVTGGEGGIRTLDTVSRMQV